MGVKPKKVKYVRTDLALEIRDNLDENCINGIEVDVCVHEKSEIKVTSIKVKNAKGEKELGKPKGTYVTIECEHIKTANKEVHEDIINVTTKELQKLLKIKKNDTVLVVGLGNLYVTPDAIGPKVVSKLLVTNHIIDVLDESICDKISKVSAITPGVMGQTGLETTDIVKGVVEVVKPKLIIAVDSLASKSATRINNTIQITDTGITPGAGVGNKRRGLNKDTLGVDVIAIGVPTVIDAKTLVMEVVDKNLNDDEADINFYNKILNSKELENITNMFVTPKEVDQIIERLSNVIANAINLSVHKGLNQNDINDFMI